MLGVVAVFNPAIDPAPDRPFAPETGWNNVEENE
jgi:hypothetical protein